LLFSGTGSEKGLTRAHLIPYLLLPPEERVEVEVLTLRAGVEEMERDGLE